jgi:hypothetical protein
MQDIGNREREQIIVEEKLRIRNAIGQLKSKELDDFLKEESPLLRREPFLRTVVDALVGAYLGIISIIIVLLFGRFFP